MTPGPLGARSPLLAPQVPGPRCPVLKPGLALPLPCPGKGESCSQNRAFQTKRLRRSGGQPSPPETAGWSPSPGGALVVSPGRRASVCPLGPPGGARAGRGAPGLRSGARERAARPPEARRRGTGWCKIPMLAEGLSECILSLDSFSSLRSKRTFPVTAIKHTMVFPFLL